MNKLSNMKMEIEQKNNAQNSMNIWISNEQQEKKNEHKKKNISWTITQPNEPTKKTQCTKYISFTADVR